MTGAPSAAPPLYIRQDGPEKVTGQGRYTADLVLPGMLHARFLYAGRPHARIRSIDVSAARALPGVMAVLTQADVPQVHYGAMVKDRTLFADGVVRFEGEVVAAVAAMSAELADEAVSLIKVDYEQLTAQLDPEAALEEGAQLVHPEWEGYEQGSELLVRKANDCGYANIVKGDLQRGMAQGDLVVEETYRCDMSHAVPIEPHAALAQWQGDKLTVWSSTQVPFLARSGVAETLQMPESNVRIIVPHLGGGFGGKCDFHFEAHVAALARATHRPVKLVFTRREEFLATDKVRHPMVMYFKTAVKEDGTITARQAKLVLDTGAYAADGPAIGEVATMMAAGPYRIPHMFIEANTVYTNRTPAGSVRAPSGPQVCWALEQHTDVVAARLGMDPVEFRLKNLADEGDEGPTGQIFTSIGTKECLTKAAELAGYRPRGEGNNAGELSDGEAVGVAVGWWFSYPSPSGVYSRLNADGSSTIITGAQENGSGAVMGLARLQAEVLGLDPKQVTLLYQDTDAGPWDNGSSGSQTTYNAGRAVLAAANEIRERVAGMAAKELEAEPSELEFVEGSVRVKGAPERSVTLAAMADKAFSDGGLILADAAPDAPPLPENNATGCAGRTAFPAFADPAFFCHAVRVRVDKETGVVSVCDVVAAHDFGRVLNLPGAEGQIEGGIAHGIGIALLEGTQYHEGKQVNPHLLDYKLQTASDAPPMRVVFVETTAVGGPLGGKGVGEPPVVPTAGAIGNAIAAATGARVHDLPMTPYRVWAAMHESPPSGLKAN